MAETTKTRMTAAEFMALPEDRHPIQLIDGEVIEMPPPTLHHQRVVIRLVMLLSQLIPDGELLTAPIAVYLDEHNIPEPDLIWVAADSQCVAKDNRLEGPPDLVVEVLSPSTARYDKTGKFALYQHHGVREYWIADPVHRLLEVWVLEDDKFIRQDVYAPEDTFESTVLGGKVVSLHTLFDEQSA